MKSEVYGEELKNIFPIVEKNLSDSGSIDNVVEFLVQCGNRSLPEAMITVVPEAWQHDELMSDQKRGLSLFYKNVSILIYKVKFVVCMRRNGTIKRLYILFECYI